MAHTTRNKERLILRVRRIRGQIESLERSLAEERECFEVLQTVAAARGALNGLMAQLIEGHLREHVMAGQKAKASQLRAADQLLAVIDSYLK